MKTGKQLVVTEAPKTPSPLRCCWLLGSEVTCGVTCGDSGVCLCLPLLRSQLSLLSWPSWLLPIFLFVSVHTPNVPAWAWQAPICINVLGPRGGEGAEQRVAVGCSSWQLSDRCAAEGLVLLGRDEEVEGREQNVLFFLAEERSATLEAVFCRGLYILVPGSQSRQEVGVGGVKGRESERVCRIGADTLTPASPALPTEMWLAGMPLSLLVSPSHRKAKLKPPVSPELLLPLSHQVVLYRFKQQPS
ncbi:hypothetical protein PAMP_005474 [Pampus punctatissimus]